MLGEPQMQLPKLFKKKVQENNSLNYNPEDLNKLPRKRRKNALRLLEEYNKGLIIEVDRDINQKDFIKTLRNRK